MSEKAIGLCRTPNHPSDPHPFAGGCFDWKPFPSEKVAKTCPTCGSDDPEYYKTFSMCYLPIREGARGCMDSFHDAVKAAIFHDPAPREATEEELRAQRAGYVRAEMAFGTDRQEAEEREATEEAPPPTLEFIGKVRRRLFINGTREWNGVVRDVTAQLERFELVDVSQVCELIGKFYRDRAHWANFQQAMMKAAPPPATESQLDIIELTQQIRALVNRYAGCAEVGCGCAGSVLVVALQEAERQLNGESATESEPAPGSTKEWVAALGKATESELRSQPEPSPDPSTVITDDFDAWWAKDGKFYDPDFSEVPWYDKRKGLAEYAYERGKLVTTRWAESYKSVDPSMLDAANIITNACQILDVTKSEWSETDAWSDWDQSVRDAASEWLKKFYATEFAAPLPGPEKPEPTRDALQEQLTVAHEDLKEDFRWLQEISSALSSSRTRPDDLQSMLDEIYHLHCDLRELHNVNRIVSGLRSKGEARPAAITALKEIVELARLADDISVCNDIAEIAEKALAESPGTGLPAYEVCDICAGTRKVGEEDCICCVDNLGGTMFGEVQGMRRELLKRREELTAKGAVAQTATPQEGQVK
jgi:hypothetical protein